MTNAYPARRDAFIQPRREAREVQQAISRIMAATDVERVVFRAITTAGEAAMLEILHIKQLQQQAEQLAPDATEAIAFAAQITTLGINRSLARFVNEIG